MTLKTWWYRNIQWQVLNTLADIKRLPYKFYWWLNRKRIYKKIHLAHYPPGIRTELYANGRPVVETYYPPSTERKSIPANTTAMVFDGALHEIGGCHADELRLQKDEEATIKLFKELSKTNRFYLG